MIVQLSVFVRNSPGELMKVTKLLADNEIQIRALTVAETADYGILRLIVNDPDKTFDILKNNNVMVGKTTVICVEMEDKPGGLHNIATILGDAKINIEYLYAFAAKKAILVMQITQTQMEEAQKVLKAKGIKQIAAKEIYSL